MSEFEFRGKVKMSLEELDEIGISHKNGWIYGHLVDGYIVSNIVEATEEYIAHEWWAKVLPETVGNYLGITDKNGQKVFKGDILKYTDIIYTDCSRTEVEEIREPALITISSYHPLAPVIKPINGGVGAWAWCTETGEGLLLGLQSEEIEVVGNIWDNSDLLGAVE